MNIEFLPSIRLNVRVSPLRTRWHLCPLGCAWLRALYPQRVGRIRKAAKAATTPLSRLVAGPGLPPRCFALKDSFQYPLEGYSDPLRAEARVESYALKDSDPLWAEAHVESYAADTRPDAPSGASNCGF